MVKLNKMSEIKIVTNNNCCDLRKHFLSLYENETQFDVILICDHTRDRDSKPLKVHRVILSAFSTYFKELFERDVFSKFSTSPVVVVMKDYDYHPLKIILDFIYKGDCCVESDQMSKIQRYARELGINSMLEIFNKSCDDSKLEEEEENDKAKLQEDFNMPPTLMEPLVELVTSREGCDYSSFPCPPSTSQPMAVHESEQVKSVCVTNEKNKGVQLYYEAYKTYEARKINPKNISKRTCPVCHKVFTRVDTMRSHFRGMHLDQKLHCVHCSMQFKWKSHLRRHNKLFHSQEQSSTELSNI